MKLKSTNIEYEMKFEKRDLTFYITSGKLKEIEIDFESEDLYEDCLESHYGVKEMLFIESIMKKLRKDHPEFL